MITRTILQLVLVNDTGDSFYRMRWPGMELAGVRPEWRVINLDAQAKERFTWGLEADLLVVIQSSDLDLIPLIEERQKRGKKTLIEYNDNFYEPPAWSPVAEPWNSPIIWQAYELIMNSGDALMVTGPGLEELFRVRTEAPVYQIENEFPRNLPPFELAYQTPSNVIRLGWAGSLGHMADILSIQPIFSQLLSEFAQLKISIMGNESIPESLHLPAERFEFTPWGSMEQYVRFWAPVQIGIAPLLDTGYNRCRSDVKALEMAATATLPVLQNSLPYEKFIRETGVPAFQNHRELAEILRSLISDPSKLKESMAAAYNYVKNTRVASVRSERLNLYEQFLDDCPPSSFTWPVGTGYHELMGSSDPQPLSTKVLREIQQLFNSGDRASAASQLEALAMRNPKNPEIQLGYFRFLLRTSREKALNFYEQLRSSFSRDLRFTIQLLLTESQSESFGKYLSELIIELEKLPERARKTYLKEIVALANRAISSRILTETQLSKLLNLYPRNPELKFQSAVMLEHSGKVAEAQTLYEQLSEEFLRAEAYDEIRASTSYGFFQAWTEGLKGRAK